MLTRSRARATNQHVFVDEKWNDVYIQTKDEQIEMLHAQRVLRSWEDERNSELDDDDDEDDDRWVSSDSDSEEETNGGGFCGGGGNSDAASPAAAVRANWFTGFPYLAGGGFVDNVVWTFMAATVAPVVLYALAWRCGRLKRRDQPAITRAWPLESQSLLGTTIKAYANVVTLGVLGWSAWWAGCGGLGRGPAQLWQPWTAWRLGLRGGTHGQHGLQPPQHCAAAFAVGLDECLHGGVEWFLYECHEVFAQCLVLALLALLLVHFHRRWLKTLVLGSALGVSLMLEVVDKRQQRLAAIEIMSIDPAFAFANESTFFAIDGQNLEQGATIAWIPYWGELQQQQLSAQACSKLYPQTLRNGGIFTAFEQLDEFVPCYRPPRQGGDFKCFEHLRLRVKDHKSVPGWSLHDDSTTQLPHGG